MFTGLIEDVGRIAEIGRRGEQFRATVAVGGLPTADIRIGDSIAVNGVCLTLVTVQPGSFAADVSPQTVARTSLAFLNRRLMSTGASLASLPSRLGGQLVYGHVDGTRAGERRTDGNSVRMRFRLGREHTRYLVAKGSVASTASA